jgi:hypothetical protein
MGVTPPQRRRRGGGGQGHDQGQEEREGVAEEEVEGVVEEEEEDEACEGDEGKSGGEFGLDSSDAEGGGQGGGGSVATEKEGWEEEESPVEESSNDEAPNVDGDGVFMGHWRNYKKDEQDRCLRHFMTHLWSPRGSLDEVTIEYILEVMHVKHARHHFLVLEDFIRGHSSVSREKGKLDRRKRWGKVVAGRATCVFMHFNEGHFFHDIWGVDNERYWDKLAFLVWKGEMNKDSKHSNMPVLEMWVKGGLDNNKVRKWNVCVKWLRYMYNYGLVGRREGWHLHHKCSAPDCVNPKHMNCGPRRENIQIRAQSLASRQAQVDARSGGAGLRDVHGRFVKRHVPRLVHIHNRPAPPPNQLAGSRGRQGQTVHHWRRGWRTQGNHTNSGPKGCH